jgi:putative hemolysin
VQALPQHHVEMASDAAVTNATGRRLPPLIKAYLRVGAKVGDGAFIDHGFNTVDVFMVMPVEQIVGRYGRRFGLVA